MRKKELISILEKQEKYLPVKELANLLNVSVRTIHNDISNLEEQGFEFDKKPGWGIYLVHKVSRTQQFNTGVAPQGRRIAIMKELLFGNQQITIQSTSDEYYVSASSILADLQYIRDEFTNEESAKLVSNISGTRFIGSEEELQKLYILFNEKEIGERVSTNNQQELKERFYQYYDVDIVDACVDIVGAFKEYTLYSVAQHYIFNVCNALVVLAFRLVDNKHHTMIHNDFNVNEIMNLNCYLIAKDLLEVLKNKLNIEYEEADIYYLSIYLQANRVRFIANSQECEAGFEQSIKNMIDRIGKNAGVDLIDDEELYYHLNLHIIHMKYRLDHHIHIRNPLLKQIKEEFRLMFDLTWLVLEEEKERLNIPVLEDEVGFLMLHFQSALDRAIKCKRVLVVCPNGYTTSNFIINRIRRVLPPLDILEAASIHDVDYFDLERIDLIISTIPLQIKNKTVIVVSDLISDQDIENIAKVYAKHIVEEPSVSIKNKHIQGMIDPSLVFVNDKTCTQEYIVNTVCQQLYKKGIVKQGFEKSIFERESKGTTAIASMAAVPHGDLSLVKKTQLAIWVNKTPVKWGKYNVKVIIFFCLHKNDLKKAKVILEDIFSLINTKERVETQIAVLSKDELIELIIGGKKFD